jgi:hypothetical protein
MPLTSIIIQQSAIMLILIVTGILCYKLKFISKDGSKEISALLLNIINPVIIVSSFQKDINSELLKNLAVTAVATVSALVIAIIVTNLIFIRNKNNPDTSIEKFSCIYSNCAFMGIPLVNALFGSEGVFYLTVFIAIFNLFVWTHGIILISGEKNFNSIKNAVISPSFISIIIGFITFIAQIKFPETINIAFGYISDVNTPLAMITAGITIAQADVLGAFKKAKVYLISAVRLIILPLILILIMKPLPFDSTVIMTILVAASTPCAAICTLLSIQYNKNSLYASEIFTVSTLLSVITLPLMLIIFQSIPF